MTADHRDDARNVAAVHTLRAVLEQASREARAAQSQLQTATVKFNAVSQQVVSLVGGSVQGIDKALVQSLQEAIHHTAAAVATLGAVSAATRVAL